ncbi:uncharacterized protein LOC116195892 isoform X2 [Punica granatum]|uniref:Uncharacterized protein LOC116195892 isoform X2 n=1 Tax=Punica granatum TaxID=22663 RepID=A0A6P8CBD5_PUNGR|nr:uncharacterized protein LOC116195892 isoform X2 [Punica granatum]
MDDMDIDHVVEVPDTPERFISRSGNHNNLSPLAELVEIPDSVDRCSHQWTRDKGMGRIANGMGQNRRPSIRPPKRIGLINESVNCSSPIIISPSDNSCTAGPHSSRNLQIDRSSENEQRRTLGGLDMDGAGATSSGCSYKLFACPRKDAAINSMGRTGEDSCYLPKSVQTFGKPCRGEEKANGSTCNATCSSALRGKGIDFSDVSIDKSPKKLPQLSRNVSSPRVAGHKRLVRNGCISPHNIASRVKELVVKNSSSGPGQMSNEVSNGSPSCTQLDEIVAEEDNRARIKGKGVLLHPRTSKEHETNLLNMSTSTCRNPTIRSDEEYKGTANASVDDFTGYESQGGWRSTRYQLRSGRAGNAASKCDNVVEKRNHHYESKSSSSGRSNFAGEAASRHVSDVHRVDGRQHFANIPIRSQNRRASISRGDARSSRLGSEDSEVMFAASSEESPDSSSVRLQNRRQRRVLDSVIEINESSPEVGYSCPRNVDLVGSPDREARVRQLEADEMLARELQEQLYNESPMELVAQMRQQGEQNHTSSTSSLSHPSPVHRSTRVTRLQRQLLPRSSRNSVNRRGRATNEPMRIQPSRRGSFRRSSTLLSRERGFHFPLDMDLDMRIDILEALEAAIGDFDGLATSANSIFRMERDFNENDYEMLLALDDDVRHVGTSSTQINSLPESKVQADVSEEACAICLENPKLGETIRHLPCLHKFHKDCIDPWLSRSTSCPVCKSSVA